MESYGQYMITQNKAIKVNEIKSRVRRFHFQHFVLFYYPCLIPYSLVVSTKKSKTTLHNNNNNKVIEK